MSAMDEAIILVAEFQHRNESLHRHHDLDKVSCSYCDLAGRYAVQTLRRRPDLLAQLVLEAADVDGGDCVHDPMLGMGTENCPRCIARRALWQIRAETPTPAPPSIIGRERFLIDKLTKTVHRAASKEHDYGPIIEERRSSRFDLKLSDDGHVARVTVELLPRSETA